MHEIRFRVPLLLGLLAGCLVAGGCNRSEGHEKVIITNSLDDATTLTMYVKAGGLGGTSGEVAYGEFANVLERAQVGPDVRDATPGEWVKIRTIIQPREGWISADKIRPAPKD